MKNSEIVDKLKELKIISFRLKMGINTIDREEYSSLTCKLDKKLEKIIEEMKNNNQK